MPRKNRKPTASSYTPSPNPHPHPLARPGNRSGAFEMKAGDRFFYLVDGRRGWADEFLHDGDAYVTFDDGTHDIIKWSRMSKLRVEGRA